MTKYHIYYLILKYPSLKMFIVACYKNRDIEKLLDLLHDLEVDDRFMYASQ